MLMTGAEIVIECLLEQGVDTIFGYPGGTILNVYDALYKYKNKINHILTSHEQGAAHAADGYARSTGKVGVCFATSGPGATNLTTGIATAYMDSSPVVFISCNVSEELIGKDSFQEVDFVGITMPITKCNYMVKNIDDLANIMREAFAIARSGRKGPVVIDILKNVTQDKTEYEKIPVEKHFASSRINQLVKRSSDNFMLPKPNEDDMEKLIDLINESKRPLVICGGGIVRAYAHKELKSFVEKFDTPVAVTVMGGGGISGRNKYVTGMIGMHGSQASNIACDRCDLLLAFGCRFSDRVTLNPKTFARNAKIVQIDIDRSEINKNIKTYHHIVGDVKQVLDILNKRIKKLSHKEWMDEIFSYNTETIYDEETIKDKLTPKQILENITELVPHDAVFATDVGQHQMWSIQHLHFEYPGQLITSGGFGTMGFGLGAAIGSQVGNKDKIVVHITGDGSFRMNLTELSTLKKYNLPILIFIFNNGVLGMVRQWQNLIYDKHFSETTLDRGPDFIKLGEAYDIKAKKVKNVEDLRIAIKDALNLREPYIIDCAVDEDEMVRPMVKGNSDIADFMIC